MIHLERRVEDIPEQPIKPLLMVSKNVCSSSKPISRLSEAEITGPLAVQDKLAKSEMQAILFYIKASENQHESGLFSYGCLTRVVTHKKMLRPLEDSQAERRH